MIPFAALGLKLLGIGRTLKSWLSELVGWIVRNPWPALAALLALTTLFLALAHNDARKDEKRAVEALTGFKQAMHSRLTNAFVKAKQVERANLARVESERKAINDKTVSRYTADLADWRARFERLRRDQANRSQARNDNLPAVPASPGRPSPADRVTFDPAFVSVRVDDLETLVRNSIQGEAIRQWVIANEAVKTGDGQ